jgi:DNA-directed RNA polymerase specialized sigma24 family protein
MPDRLPLTQHIDTLYPVARVLVGDAAAPRLVQEVFRRAVHIPEDQRPSDTEQWLIHLLLDVRAGKAAPEIAEENAADIHAARTDTAGEDTAGEDTAGEETRDDHAAKEDAPEEDVGGTAPDFVSEATEYDGEPGSTNASESDSPSADLSTSRENSGGVDSNIKTSAETRPELASSRGFRREVARSVAERALPVALAACSEQERALLTLHASGARPDSTLAPIAKTIAGDVGTALDEAYGELRAALRDVLSGPERMLIDTALPDAAMESVLKAYVTNQYHPAPARLRSDVAGIVKQSRSGDDSEDRQRSRMSKDDLLSVTLQRVGLTLLIVTVIAGAVYAAVTLIPSTPEPEPTQGAMSLVELSANRIGRVQALAQTPDPDSVAATIRSEFGRRLRVPRIEQAGVSGVGVLDLGPAQVPAILYADSTVAQSPLPVIKTLVYSYALIDNLGGMADLEPELRRGLETADSVMVRTSGEARVALWRNADDVFVTIATNTDGDAADLGERVKP